MPTNQEAPLVEFDKVKKAFGSRVVYEDLTLKIYRGETLTVMGGSGTGKSVLLKLMIGLLHADEGAIRIDGQDIVDFDDRDLLPVRRRISMLFQGGALFDSITVGENVAYPLRERGHEANHKNATMTENEIADRVAEKLALVGLPGIEELKPAELSGGMKKRVALARAIAADPDVILYDEPTTGLDPINIRRINDLIRSIQHKLKVTSVVVTHDLPTAYQCSDRIAMLHEKRIFTVLPTKEFWASKEPAVSDFIHAMPLEGQGR